MEEATARFNNDLDRKLEEELKASLVDGYLPCAVAFKIARKLKVTLKQVGDAANRLNIRIVNCQLGFFKVEKATHSELDGVHISEKLAEEIEASLVEGRLSCPVTFKIAKKLKATPRQVGDTATKLNIKISSCQLGCFP